MRHSILIHSILILTSLLSIPAFGGIRIINGGGGFAEMRALTALARLQFMVRPCTMHPDSCQLSEAERQYLSRGLSARLFDTSSINLEFFSSENAADDYRVSKDGKTFFLNTKIIYNAAHKPLDYREIARIVFLGWLQHFGGNIPDTLDYGVLAQKVFGHMLIRESEEPIDQERIARAFMLSSMSDPVRQDAILVIEGTDRTMDVTSMLAEATNCRIPARIRDISGIAYETPVLTGSVTWDCGQIRKQARFALQTHVLHVTLFSEKIVTQPKCEQDLQ